MSERSAVVAINALMLKRTKLAGIRQVRAEGTGSRSEERRVGKEC